MLRHLLIGFMGLVSITFGGELEDFVASAEKKHGEFGAKAAKFLVEGMPKRDRETLSEEFLMVNLDLALKAREEFPWAAEVPEEVFFNDVLPYASLDETREDWRTGFYPQCAEIVKDAKSAGEAAQLLNQKFFKLINVHYGRKRKAPNQSPAESIEQSKATCTGLSIILVDACRAVGVPARVVGTAMWAKKQGNHTWVEIYDGGVWSFMGADEFDPKGMNRGWFVKDASQAIEGKWQHAIWASSWKEEDSFFPMVWAIRNREVSGVNVTARYVKKNEGEEGVVFFRVWDVKGGKRLVVTLNGSVKTKAGRADLNDMAGLKVKVGDLVKVRFGKETREVKVPEGKTVDLYWNELK